MNPAGSQRGGRLLALGTGGLLAAAAIRTMVALPPWRWFDADPLHAAGALEGAGPGASLLLDLAMCFAAAAVLAGVVRRGGRLDPIAILLWMLPLPWLWWHGRHDLEQAWRGGTLAAAWLGLLAAAHLRQSPGHRLLLAAGLLACAAPWIARGATQWFIEHPAMVAHFDAERSATLAAFGWEEGGEAALQYERRLRQREATGWFGLANVFSSLLAAAAVAWASLAAASRGRRLGGGTVLVALGLAAGAAAGVAMNGSKGAIAALVAGAAFAIAMAVRPRKDLAARAVLLAVPLGLGAILLRGLLPEDLLGERSLLFRWHYLVGAVRVAAWVPLTGAGPAGFQEWYLLQRPLRSPEAVQSAHSLLADSLVAVGVVALAWISLLARTLWPRTAEAEAGGHLGGGTAVAVLLSAGVAAAAAMAAAAPGSLALGSLWTWIGAGLFVPAAMAAWAILRAVPPAWASALLAAAAFTLLLHGQVEMTFFNQGSLPWAMLLVGLAGSAGLGESAGRVRLGIASAVLPAAAGVLLLAGPIRDAIEAERSLREAAAPLGACVREAESSRRPLDPQAVRDARSRAADRLAALAAGGRRAASHAASLEVAQRLAIALGGPGPDAAATRAAFAASLAAADEAIAQFGPSAERLSDRAMVLAAWRRAQPGEVAAEALAEALRQAIARHPGDPLRWLELGDALRDAGEAEAAREAWSRAIEFDEARELDPLVRLPEATRRAIAERLRATE